MKNTLTTEQIVRMAELTRKKQLTQQEDEEYMTLLTIQNGGKPVTLKPALPWYIFPIQIVCILGIIFLLGLANFPPSPSINYASDANAMLGSSFVSLIRVVVGIVVGAWIPRAEWQHRQHTKAEKAEQTHP